MSRAEAPRRWSVDRVALAFIAITTIPAGLQAAFTPRSFFDDFPIGRAWISDTGDSYNEHLVRDVGALFLALALATLWTVLRRGPTQPLAGAWLVFGLFHLVFHTRHLDGYETTDRIGLVASVMIVPALAVAALWAGRNRQ